MELDGPVQPPLPQGQVDARNLRVSDAEREHVVGLLQRAVAQGLLTLDEFTERTDLALASRVRAELNAVLIDLPGIGQTANPVAAPGVRPLELKTRAGDIKQVGHWVVPAQIVAECTMGNVKLDFTEAEVHHHDIVLRARCGSGSISVIVPHGWQVVLEEVVTGMGDVVNKATEPPVPGQPVLHVYGKVGMGNIKIRYPRGRR